MVDQTFSNIPWDAPLFRKAPLSLLDTIVSNLSDASYHYADDSGKEWGNASLKKMQAALLVNTFALPYAAIVALHGAKPQLITLSDFMDEVLKDARK